MTALIDAIMTRPAIWGLAGSFVYASTQLGTALFSEAGNERRVILRAWLQFVTAVFFGAVAAEGFGPTISDLTHSAVRPQAAWLVVGLSANAMWPVLERLLGARLGAIVRALLGERP